MVSRHYPYKIPEAMKLTPRQAFAMMVAYGEERKEMFLALATMLGGKPKEGDGTPVDESKKIEDFDNAKIDSLTKSHANRLKMRAKNAAR